MPCIKHTWCKVLIHTICHFVTVPNTLEVSKRNDKKTVNIKHSEHRRIDTLRREMMSSGSKNVWIWSKTSGGSVERERWAYSDVVCDRWRLGAGRLNIAKKRDRGPISSMLIRPVQVIRVVHSSIFQLFFIVFFILFFPEKQSQKEVKNDKKNENSQKSALEAVFHEIPSFSSSFTPFFEVFTVLHWFLPESGRIWSIPGIP